MTHATSNDLTKSIKKNIYGKAQIAKIIFPPGFGAIAFEEAKEILQRLWIAKKFTGKIYLLKNEIQVRPVYLLAIIELLLRNHCFTDVRLVIAKETVIGKKAFAKIVSNIKWDYYINKSMLLKIKVNSIASKAFHETGLREILAEAIKPYAKDVVSGDNAEETTCLYAELYKDKLTLSISLAGQPLYKRGYRGQLSASAPLREDLAACCIKKAFLFAKNHNDKFIPKTLLIPFSGTGTFHFEFYQLNTRCIPVLLKREYALQKMSFFRKTNFDLLVNKAQEEYSYIAASSKHHEYRVMCIDRSKHAITALNENSIHFRNTRNKIKLLLPDMNILHDDFFKINFNEIADDLFMPLNPPYGLRLGDAAKSIALFKKIAEKINELAVSASRNQRNILGFILCPTEDTWSAFIRNLSQAKTETYHMTQGGLDIRVCQFYISL